LFTPSFLTSAASPGQFPPDVGREVAFVGRSNSGKSSALNAILGMRSLARVSKTPGRTQLVNFFSVGEDRRVTDLPGYGYARVDPATRERWERLLGGYLEGRRSLAGLVMTVDIRRGITELDDTLLRWLQPRGLPVVILLTKADKLSRGAGLQQQRLAAAHVGPEVKLTRCSAIGRDGVEEARGWLEAWLGPRE